MGQTMQSLYVTDRSNSRLIRADINGSNVASVFTGLGGLLSGIDLDAANDLLYWTNFGTSQVRRAFSMARSRNRTISPSTPPTGIYM